MHSGDFRFGSKAARVRGMSLSAPVVKRIVQISHEVIDGTDQVEGFKRRQSEHVSGCAGAALMKRLAAGSAGAKCSHLDAVWRPRVHKQRASGVLSPHNMTILSGQAWSQHSAVLLMSTESSTIKCLLTDSALSSSLADIGCKYRYQTH